MAINREKYVNCPVIEVPENNIIIYPEKEGEEHDRRKKADRRN